MKKIKIIIAEEIFRFGEEWLGIDGITKQGYEKSMEGQRYWALFANIYDRYFEHIDNKDEVDDMTEKLLSEITNPKVIQAILFFSEYRKSEL